MKKERLKSITLILLIVFNLILAERILVNESLWPSGYRLFNIDSHFSDFSGKAREYISLPERIIVNTGNQSGRFECNRASEKFDDIYAVAKEVIASAFSKTSRDVTTVSGDEWYAALTGKSLYLSYASYFSAKNLAALLDTSTELSFGSFSDIVIADNGNVFIGNTATDTFFKIDILSSKISPIIDAELSEEADTAVINYSFDLNFDKDFGDQKTVLSPMIPIYSVPVEANAIEASNPVFRGGEVNERAISGILAAFSINPGTVWRYTEADGTLVFVENTGILRISPDGLLTFSATSDGISISSQEAVPAGLDVAELVSRVCSGVGCNSEMYLTSSLTLDSAAEFTFDYMIGGLPIRFNGLNAVQITVRDGRITEYAQLLRKYTPCGYTAASPLYIETLDNIIARYSNSMSKINIIRMFPAYVDDLTYSEKLPDWFLEIDNVLAE